MVSLGYNIIRNIISSQLKFFPVYPLISENKERDDYLSRLISSRHIFETEVIFIDSLSSLIKFDIDEKSSIDLMGFFKRISATGKAIVLTATENELDQNTMNEIESAVSLLIETSTKKFGADLKNLMMIKKYNFALSQYAKQTAFRVEPKIGLVVEIAAVA
jgi:flagellar protein FlaH